MAERLAGFLSKREAKCLGWEGNEEEEEKRKKRLQLPAVVGPNLQYFGNKNCFIAYLMNLIRQIRQQLQLACQLIVKFLFLLFGFLGWVGCWIVYKASLMKLIMQMEVATRWYYGP